MKHKAHKLAIVNTTVSSRAAARKLASAIIESRLAACVQIAPIRSIYRWKGRVESASELILMAKTRAGLAARLMAFIECRHPYDTPEILAAPVAAVSGKYGRWVAAETSLHKKGTRI